MRIQILKVGARAGQIVADDGMINRMAAVYDPRHHEAPLIIGTDGETDPAVGWVSSLSKEGDALYAEIKQILGQVENELKAGRRQVRRVGFYPGNYGLRHISLTGEPILLPGICTPFKEKGQYFEFEQGGDSVKLKDDPRMKAFLRLGDEINCALQPKQFSEGDDPGEILHRKAMDILMNPPGADKWGRPISGSINYSMAFEMACEQNPDLAAQYIQQIEETRARSGLATLQR